MRKKNIFAGIDMGTRFLKICLCENDKIIHKLTSPTGKDVLNLSFKKILKESNLKKKDIQRIVATGYGANFVSKAAFSMSDAPCIARGGFKFDNSVNTIIDAGGLFIRAVNISNKGFVDDSIINEKCAAGSGKFLEMIAKSINISMEEISKLAEKSKNPIDITSSCAVFAESEVISRVNTGATREDVIAGVINSIASRAATLIKKIQPGKNIYLTGGLSKIEGFRIALMKKSNLEIKTFDNEPDIVQAYGAALLAGKNIK